MHSGLPLVSPQPFLMPWLILAEVLQHGPRCAGWGSNDQVISVATLRLLAKLKSQCMPLALLHIKSKDNHFLSPAAAATVTTRERE